MQQKKYKVLFLSSWYPNRVDNSLGIFVKRHAEAVSSYCNVASLYVCSDLSLKNKTYESVETNDHSIYTVNVYYKKVTSRIPFVSSLIKCCRYLNAHRLGFKLIKANFGKPDIVHANVIFPVGIISLLLKYFYSIPFIVTEHWSGYLPADGIYKGSIRKMVTRWAVRFSKAITVVSEDLKKAMLKQGLVNNYHVVYNVVDTNSFYHAQQRSADQKKKILYVGGLEDRSKNISGMIRTIKKLSLQRHDFELHIVGDGIDRKALESLSNELEMSNKFIFFDGYFATDKIAEIMRGYDFFVLFSNYETFSVVTAEAMTSGLPVIVTNCGGPQEYVTKEIGKIINAGDEDMLRSTINFMLDNYRSYNKEEIAKYAREKFSYENVGKKFYDIYKMTLN